MRPYAGSGVFCVYLDCWSMDSWATGPINGHGERKKKSQKETRPPPFFLSLPSGKKWEILSLTFYK